MSIVYALACVSLLAYANSVPPDICFQEFNWDDCGGAPKHVLYYYKSGSRCEIGIWRGCLPNQNMFIDEYECVNTCIFTERAKPEDFHKLHGMPDSFIIDADSITEETDSDSVITDSGSNIDENNPFNEHTDSYTTDTNLSTESIDSFTKNTDLPSDDTDSFTDNTNSVTEDTDSLTVDANTISQNPDLIPQTTNSLPEDAISPDITLPEGITATESGTATTTSEDTSNPTTSSQ